MSFYCQCCKFNCDTSFNWNRHLQTKKHIKLTNNDTPNTTIDVAKKETLISDDIMTIINELKQQMEELKKDKSIMLDEINNLKQEMNELKTENRIFKLQIENTILQQKNNTPVIIQSGTINDNKKETYPLTYLKKNKTDNIDIKTFVQNLDVNNIKPKGMDFLVNNETLDMFNIILGEFLKDTQYEQLPVYCLNKTKRKFAVMKFNENKNINEWDILTSKDIECLTSKILQEISIIYVNEFDRIENSKYNDSILYKTADATKLSHDTHEINKFLDILADHCMFEFDRFDGV